MPAIIGTAFSARLGLMLLVNLLILGVCRPEAGLNEQRGPMPARSTLRLRISGIVQGVGYRAWAAREATKLGLAGWVRNLPDGSVEAQVHGLPERIETFILSAWKGPRMARVDHIERAPDASPARSDFVILD